MIKGVIFDMDGVLVDSEPFYHSQRLEYLRRMDYTPASTIHLVGSNEPEVWEALVPGDQQMKEELLMGYHAFRRLHPTPYQQLLNPGAVDLLSELKRRGLKTASASSSVRESVVRMIDSTGISSMIDYFISGEDCSAYKPDPEVYQRALEALGLFPDEAFAVEDSPSGISAAINAGMKVYALYGAGLDQCRATAVVNMLKELLEYL